MYTEAQQAPQTPCTYEQVEPELTTSRYLQEAILPTVSGRLSIKQYSFPFYECSNPDAL